MNIVPDLGGERKSRKASKETRQQQLIEATIDSLAKRGYSDTTLANVADGAGLSRGIVNFHFESKEKLLISTLQFMSDEYASHWNAALRWRQKGSKCHWPRPTDVARCCPARRKLRATRRASAVSTLGFTTAANGYCHGGTR